MSAARRLCAVAAAGARAAGRTADVPRLDASQLAAVRAFAASGGLPCLAQGEAGAASETPPRWHAPAEAVRLLLAEARLPGVLPVLPLLLRGFARYAQAPVSEFHVPAAAVGSRGDVYMGVNVEFAGAAIGNSVHAEQFAIAHAHMRGEAGGLALIACRAPACGHCRQFMTELHGASDLQLAVLPDAPSAAAPCSVTPFRELLPESFGPRELGMSGPFLLGGGGGGGGAAHDVRVRGPLCASGNHDGWRELTEAAAEAAGRSYVPYTKSASGVALEAADASGGVRVFVGCPIESVAFNPTLPPLQYALVAMHMALCMGRGAGAGAAAFAGIKRAVLVERPGARVSYAAQTRGVLAALAPSAEVRHVVAVT